MLRPVIFIGCGGAGVKTVRLIREQCQKTLERAGWRNGIPKAWQFIGIDSPITQEDSTIPFLPNNDYCSLSLDFKDFGSLNRALETKFGHETNPKAFRELQGWRPSPHQVDPPIKSSPPSGRGVGRLASLLALQDVVQSRLRYAFLQCTAGGTELAEVSRQLRVSVLQGTEVPDPITVIVGSMAGATGSGIMLDVVDLVQSKTGNGAFPVLVAYTPDVTSPLVRGAPSSVANSAAFLAELLSAYWNHESTDSALIPASVAANTRGPHSIFLIGRTNIDGFDLWDSKNVYQAVGNSLAAVVTSPTVQTSFHDFLLTDWTPRAQSNAGGYGFNDGQLPGVASSFGSATIAIGRDRFRSYLAKLLHRSIVEHLATGFEPAAAAEFGDTAKSMASPTKIFELVQRRQVEFAISCGLHESIEGPNLISDHFVSRQSTQTRLSEVSNKIRSPFDGTRQKFSEWQDLLMARAVEVRAAELEAIESELKSGLREWGTAILEKVLRATTEFSGTYSFPVTLELLRSLRAQVIQTSGQMREDAEKARNSAKEAAQRVQSRLGEKVPGILAVDNVAVHELIGVLAVEIVLAWSAQVREVVAVALESVATNMLSNLEGSVNQAITRINILTNPHDGRPSETSFWPKNDDVVPTSIAPGPTEFLLEDYLTWPEEAKSLLSESLGESAGLPMDPVGAARQLILRGGFGGDADSSTAAPFVWAASASGRLVWEPGQNVQTVIGDDVDTLAARIDAWLTRPHTAVRRFVMEGLATYLLPVDVETGAEIPDHQQRLATFREKLQIALLHSRPLVEIDTVMNATVHRNPLRFDYNISGFPFGDGHPAREITSQMIQGHLGTSESFDWAFSSSNAESVLITSFLHYPVNPSVITSFTRPLHGAIGSFTPNLLRSSFWQWRRARILENFIPLPDDLRVAAIRGFAMARILGTMTALPAGKNQISTKAGVLNFPPNFLTETDRNNVLPSLLESMVLVFGEAPTRGKAAFEAYGALVEYGSGGGMAAGFEVEGLAAQVLSTGDYDGVAVVDEARANALKNDPNGRIANAIAYLDANIKHFDELDAKPLHPHSWRNQVGAVEPVDTMTRELIADLRSGYLMVREAIERFRDQLEHGIQVM